MCLFFANLTTQHTEPMSLDLRSSTEDVLSQDGHYFTVDIDPRTYNENPQYELRVQAEFQATVLILLNRHMTNGTSDDAMTIGERCLFNVEIGDSKNVFVLFLDVFYGGKKVFYLNDDTRRRAHRGWYFESHD